jgi:hypothetical protein
MNLVDRVVFSLKKNLAASALRIAGYVVDYSDSVKVFDGDYEFCRLQREQYMVVNDVSFFDERADLKAFLFDDKNHTKACRVFSVLGINMKRASYFVTPDGDKRIVE